MSAFLQEQNLEVNTLRILRQGHQAVLQENTELKKELARMKETKESTEAEEPPSKKSRIGDKDGPVSEYGGSQSGRGQYLCYRCHGNCGKSAKHCEVPLASLKGSSLIDLYSRVYVRKRPDVRREGEAVMEELRQRGLALPVDELTAQSSPCF